MMPNAVTSQEKLRYPVPNVATQRGFTSGSRSATQMVITIRERLTKDDNFIRDNPKCKMN